MGSTAPSRRHHNNPAANDRTGVPSKEGARPPLTAFEGYILDLDGTVYRGERLVPGARDVVCTLRAAGKRVVFLSNKPIETRTDYAAKLTRLGIPTEVDDVINSSLVMARYLADHAPGCRAYVIGEAPLVDELRGAGIEVVEDPVGSGTRVEYVVIAFDRTFTYAKLNCALQAVRCGARLVATNADKTCPVEGGEIPDAAGMIGAVEGTTGRKVELVVGKPNPMMLETASRRLGLKPNQCLMVGDRLETDVLMGKLAGMTTALVLTGVTRREDLSQAHVQPDYVLDSIADMLQPE
ncbi:MAG: phosphoglycolate/pyridoxal phosphate family phosphatase [Bacillota bacterium]